MMLKAHVYIGGNVGVDATSHSEVFKPSVVSQSYSESPTYIVAIDTVHVTEY